MTEPSRTTVEADDALLAEAAAALGTTGPEETVRAALELAARRRPGSPPWPGRPLPGGPLDPPGPPPAPPSGPPGVPPDPGTPYPGLPRPPARPPGFPPEVH